MTKQYVVYDFEEPGDGRTIWHIFSVDGEPEEIVTFGHTTILQIIAPESYQMRHAISNICTAINGAIALVDTQADVFVPGDPTDPMGVSGGAYAPEPARERWEYLEETASLATLDLAGKEGWELVAVSDCVAYMKRRRP